MIVSFYDCVFVTQSRRNYKTDLTKIWNGDRSQNNILLEKILACFCPERIHVSHGVCEKLKFALSIIRLRKGFF